MTLDAQDPTNDDLRYAELFSPGIVRMVASPDTTTKIDPQLFPISDQEIGDMPNYLDKINEIIIGGGLKAINQEKLQQIQALIRGNNNPEEINQIEMILNLNEKVWIHFYMKWLRRDEELSRFNAFGSSHDTEPPMSEEAAKKMAERIMRQLGQTGVVFDKFRKR